MVDVLCFMVLLFDGSVKFEVIMLFVVVEGLIVCGYCIEMLLYGYFDFGVV